jgi:hypothetical protein
MAADDIRLTADGTSLPVLVTLAEPLCAAATAPVRRRIEDELSDLLRDLGMAAKPAVELRADSALPRKHLIRVEVAGRPCRLPRTSTFEALAYVEATPLVARDLEAEAVLERLGGPGAVDTDRLGELVGLVCRAAVSAQPDALLPNDPLTPALALGMSMTNRDTAALRDSFRTGPIEPLMADLAATDVELIVEPEYFQALTMAGAGGELVPDMRDKLSVELGFSLPPMHVRHDSSLRSAGFAFRFNGVRTLPRIGLPPETIFVNDTVERLRLMNVEGQPTLSPATDRDAAIVAKDHQGYLKEAGLTVWDPFDYFILALAVAIRRNAFTLMTTTLADAMLGQLGKAFPAIADAVGLYGLRDVLTSTLRELLRDRVSIRNLRRIAEVLVRGASAPEETGIADHVRLVRSGLGDQITHTLARQTDTLVAYLLDPEIEKAIAGYGRGTATGPPDTLTERLCDALYDEIVHLPGTTIIPAVLTSGELRGAVRARLQYEFPELAVVSYEEIPDRFNIQPVARISWGG